MCMSAVDETAERRRRRRGLQDQLPNSRRARSNEQPSDPPAAAAAAAVQERGCGNRFYRQGSGRCGEVQHEDFVIYSRLVRRSEMKTRNLLHA